MEELSVKEAIHGSLFTFKYISFRFSVPKSTLYGWNDTRIVPRKENQKSYNNILDLCMKNPRIPYHPSFGYATEEQIKELESLGVGEKKNRLLRDIEKQVKSKGKKS